jgi:hypothetical protein
MLHKAKSKSDNRTPVIGRDDSQKLVVNHSPMMIVNNKRHSFSPKRGDHDKIIACHSNQEIIDAVKWARDRDIKLSAQRGGKPEGAAFLDLSAMNGISMDKEEKSVKVQGGTLVRDLDGHTFPHGLAVPAGMVSHNRLADLLPIGGQSFLMHKYGLTVDNLRSVEMVLEDGRMVTASPRENKDLFTALKGGGRKFGIITSMEFTLRKIEKESIGGMLIYPIRLAKKVVHSYRKYVSLTPNEMSASLLFLTMANGLKAVAVHSAWVGEKEEGLRQIGIFQGLIEPLADFVQEMPYNKLQKGLDPYIPGIPRSNIFSGYFPTLSHELIENLLFFAERISSSSKILVNCLKGMVSGNAPESATFSDQKQFWYVEIIPRWDTPNEKEVQMDWASGLWEAISSNAFKPEKLGYKYKDRLASKGKGNWWRQTIKKYDPDHYFD